MGKFLTLDERKKFRGSIEKLTKFNNRLETALRRKHDIPLHIRQQVYAMTGCSDMGEAFDALLEIKDITQQEYLTQLRGMAPKSLSAFAEYMNPDEPPAPHHEFLIEHLEAIESGDLVRMLLSMPPGHAKPIVGYAPVLTGKGTYKRLDEIVVGDTVVTHNGRLRPVTAVYEQGELPVWQVRLRSGKIIECAGDHTFLTGRGWLQVKDMNEKDCLIPVACNDFKDNDLYNDDEFVVAGHFAAFRQVTTDSETARYFIDTGSHYRSEDFQDALTRLGIPSTMAFRNRAGNTPSRLFIEPEGNLYIDDLGLAEFLENDRVPEWVFHGSNRQIKLFLDALWSVTYHDVQRSSSPVAYRRTGTFFRTEEMGEDVAKLFWRLGINVSAHHRFVDTSTENKGHSLNAYHDFTFNSGIHLKGEESSKFAGNFHVKDGNFGVIPFFASNYDPIVEIVETERTESMRCLTVEEDHSFTVWGIVAHNSTYASHLFPAWWLGRNPKKRYLQAGHTQKFVEDELGKKVRNNIKSEAYNDVFPDVTIPHDSNAAATFGIAKFNGKYVARAVGQGIAGLRGHIAGVDDPYPSLKEAESPTYRKQVIDWFNADFKTRLLPGSPLFVVATRWHPEDLCGILEEESKKGKIIPYTVINLPVICLDPSTDPLKRELNQLLWEYYTENDILDLKNSLSARQYAALYLGNPIPESGNMMKTEWLKYYKVLPTNTDKFVTISVDTANKATERSDYTVITVWYQYGSKHYLVDVIRRKMEYNEIVSTIELHARKHNADVILVEDAGTGSQYAIQANNTDHVPPCPVIPIKTGGKSKEFRYDASLPQFESGNVYFKEDADWIPVLEKELMEFPLSANDDQVDSISQYLVYRRPKPKFGSQKMNTTKSASASRSKVLGTPFEVAIRPGFVDMSKATNAET